MIKKYTDIVFSPEKLKERLSVSLTEVEKVEDFGEKYEGIVIVEVKSVEKHPKSSGLLVLKVFDGDNNLISVVQNCPVKVGDKVAFIKPGINVPGINLKVEKTKVKGVLSDGFIPSGRELGLNYDHTTVYTLDKNVRPGVFISEALDLDDKILEIKNKTLTHRPDTFGLYGIAREVSAVQNTKLKKFDWVENYDKFKLLPDQEHMPLEVSDESKGLCKRYVAVVIKDVQIKESPLWLQVELSKLGVHPVNNVVDVSNYLMLVVGQPSHAFDYDKVVTGDPKSKGRAVIRVRVSKEGEKIMTLDGNVRELDNEMVVISDSVKPIGIAGVMGGKETEISCNTKNIIYQVENLDMYNVRRTSMKLGLFTDAVTRFSKGLDPNMCGPVLYKAVEMVLELTGGKIASKVIDIYPNKVKEKLLKVDTDIIRKRIGIAINDEEIIDILRRLQLGVKKLGKSKLCITVPTFRPDLNIPEDINEEVARIHGYDKVKVKLPVRKCEPVVDDKYRENISKIKNILYSFGSHELYTYSFVSASLYKKCNLSVENCYRLVNAISPELVYVRPLIVPSLLEKIEMNFKNFGDYSSFEIDKVDLKDKKNYLPDEPWHVGFTHTVSYYHCKKYLDELMKSLGVLDYKVVPVSEISADKLSLWLKYTRGLYNIFRSGVVKVGERYVGIVGQIDLETIENLNLPDETSCFEINLDDIEIYVSDFPNYEVISRYPEVVRDYSFLTDLRVKYIELESAIKSADLKEGIIKSVDCVDIYKGGSDKKKTTMRVVYQSMSKTLQDLDVRKVEKRIMDSVKRNVSGYLAK